jgi:hypothetical protein
MASKVSIVYATRTDGNGKPVKGFYVTDCGIPVGPAHATRDAAVVTSRLYVADVYRCIAQVSNAK